MSFTGSTHHRRSRKSFAEFAREINTYSNPSDPVLIRASKGYWAGSYGNGHPDSHDWRLYGFTTERNYTLGVIASGRILSKKEGLIVPVKGSVSWQSRKTFQDPIPFAPWANGKHTLRGINWLEAEVEESDGGPIVVRPMARTEKSDDSRVVHSRVKIEDEALDLDLRPSQPNGNLRRFAAIDIAYGKGEIEEVLTTAEGQDEILGKILRGGVRAFSDAASPDTKVSVAQEAISLGEEVDRREQEAMDQYWPC